MKKKVMITTIVLIVGIVFSTKLFVKLASNRKSANLTISKEYYSNPYKHVYKEVLQSKTEFFTTDGGDYYFSSNKENICLDTFLNKNYDISGDAMQIDKFSIIDMDGDTIPEIILQISIVGKSNISDYGFEVLHYKDGVVYGYTFVHRAMMGLKMDGTFDFSSGAADNGYGKIQFSPTDHTIDVIMHCETDYDNEPYHVSYYIGKEMVDEEAYRLAYQEHDEENAVWYDFTQENIDTYIR